MMEDRSMSNLLEGCQFTPPAEVAEVFHQIDRSDPAFHVRGTQERILLHYQSGAELRPIKDKVGGWNQEREHWYISKMIADETNQILQQSLFKWKVEATHHWQLWDPAAVHAQEFQRVVVELTAGNSTGGMT